MRLAHTSRKAFDQAFLDVSGRVASALMDLCHEPDAEKNPMEFISALPAEK